MDKKLNLFNIFPEIAPFAKTDYVADVGGQLPRFFKDAGHDIRIIMPQYRVTNERRYILRDVIRLQDIQVNIGSEDVRVNAKSAFLPNSKVQVYFVDHKPFFFREGLYCDSLTGEWFKDNDLRFFLLAKSALETLKKLQWHPDVIHCHGWQTAILPFLLKTEYTDDSFFDNVVTVFTLYSSQMQKCGWNSVLGDIVKNNSNANLPDTSKPFDFLRMGLLFSDHISAPGYDALEKISEIYKDDSGLLKIIKNASVVPSGIDTVFWNPENTVNDCVPYSIDTLEQKQENKIKFADKCFTGSENDFPIIYLVVEDAGKTDEKFIAELCEKIIQFGVFIVLKSSDTFSDDLKLFLDNKSGQICVLDEPGEEQEFEVYASVDITLFLQNGSRDNDIPKISMRFGTVPVMPAIEGLDSGYIYKAYSLKEIMKTIKSVLADYKEKNAWQEKVKQVMQADYSWSKTVDIYTEIYTDIVKH